MSTATEARSTANDLFADLANAQKIVDGMARGLHHAGLTKAQIADEARGVARLANSLDRCWRVLAEIDRGLAKLEREGARGRGYAMPPSPLEGLSFMKASPREVRRGVPFDRPAATEAVATYGAAIAKALASTGASVAEEIRKADMSKAASGDDATDTGDSGIDDLLPAAIFLSAGAIAAIAARIARGLDLTLLQSLAENSTPGQFAADVVGEALAGLGLDIAPAVVTQIQSTAVLTATARAHELVALRPEHGGAVGDPGAQRPITTTTRDMVKAAVADGLWQGLDAGAITDSIGALDAFSPERGALIAETELRTVNAGAAVAAYQGAALASGATILKAWVTDPSSNVCDVCHQNEAQGAIPLDQALASGDHHPPQHPRCVCSIAPVVSNPASSTASPSLQKKGFTEMMTKRDWTAEQRATCARSGLAMPNGDFPILGREDLQDAIDSHENARDPEAAQAHIVGRAKTLGATNMLPSHWPGSTKPADKLAAALKTPFEASATVLAGRLVLAKSASARASVEADAITLTRNLGATEAIRRAQRAPISCLKIGA